MNKMFNLPVLCLILAVWLTSCNTPQQSTQRVDESVTPLPNVVFLLVDDLGLSSVPSYENQPDSIGWTAYSQTPTDSIKYAVPHIFSFSQEARTYTNMYATSLCAPSRGQLITGRYPFRNGIVFPGWEVNDTQANYYQNNVASNSVITSVDGYLNTDQIGYPKVLQEMGYNTIFGGKWNLRYGQTMGALDGDSAYYIDTYVKNQAQHLNDLGFSQTFAPVALVGNTIDYYPPELENNPTLAAQYLPNTLHDWMTQQAKYGYASGTPQYIHYCFGLIHDPYGSQEYGYSPPPFDAGESNPDTVWADKMKEVDLLIGKFVATIDSLDFVNNTETLIILAGDNGTEPPYYSRYNNEWVKGGKFSNASHGSRVPFMVRWPDRVAPGIDTTLADFSDIFPTMVEIAGGEQVLDSLVDSTNPGYTPTYVLNEAATDTSYIFDGQSLLYDMTGDSSIAKPQPPRIGIYAQTQSQAFISNGNYMVSIASLKPPGGGGIYQASGYYETNNNTLDDQAIAVEDFIPSIGGPMTNNPYQPGTAVYNNYQELYFYYYEILFPEASYDVTQ